MKKWITKNMIIESWWNRTLPVTDLDFKANGSEVLRWPQYRMTREAWIESIKKDLEKHKKILNE